MTTRYEWTTTIPYSPFYHREYDWFGQAQVHSCALCNEELHRAPDGVAGGSGSDLLAKKFIHHHFIGVRHENNLKEVIDVARSTCTCIASTQTQTNGITRRKLRSNNTSHNKTPACKVCDSLLHAVGTKAGGSFLMSASHLEQLHHKKSAVKFQELAEKETRLILFKKSATAVAATTLEISAAHDLPNDIGMSILRFVGIQQKPYSASTRSVETQRTTSQPNLASDSLLSSAHSSILIRPLLCHLDVILGASGSDWRFRHQLPVIISTEFIYVD